MEDGGRVHLKLSVANNMDWAIFFASCLVNCKRMQAWNLKHFFDDLKNIRTVCWVSLPSFAQRVTSTCFECFECQRKAKKKWVCWNSQERLVQGNVIQMKIKHFSTSNKTSGFSCTYVNFYTQLRPILLGKRLWLSRQGAAFWRWW